MAKKHLVVKDSKQLQITKIIVFVIFVAYALSLIFPFVWMIYNSFKTNSEFFENVWALPKDLSNGLVNLEYALSMKISD
jgi:ABC-type glycerol-3-phosphate transport system permease component